MVTAKLASKGALARYARKLGSPFALAAFMLKATADIHRMIQTGCIVWVHFEKLFEGQVFYGLSFVYKDTLPNLIT